MGLTASLPNPLSLQNVSLKSFMSPRKTFFSLHSLPLFLYFIKLAGKKLDLLQEDNGLIFNLDPHAWEGALLWEHFHGGEKRLERNNEEAKGVWT